MGKKQNKELSFHSTERLALVLARKWESEKMVSFPRYELAI